MPELYPNTTILDVPRTVSQPVTYHSIYGLPLDVIIPICAVLWVVWYFQGRPELKIYAVAMAVTFALLASWVVIALGFALIMFDKIEQYFKKKQTTKEVK